ncbi:response regulator [Methanoregula sp.]|uniref:response regulator n=1 Tax=Methanoregula sp. TaxID=2052170 RepID=UPI00260D5DDA|nr:response regulator [Methanoregula sp.]MDD5144222.1 response regulator [Methanoregula sp.]
MTKVLVADDNPQNLYLLETILKGNGYEVVSANNGAEALAAAKKSPPDLIVTDILMPVMDGFELCRQWKADPVLHAVPFIFYTATYTDPKDEKFALNLGADRFLIKPQKPDFLLKEITAVLDESFRKNTGPSTRPLGEEMEVLRQYNAVLFRKLEEKVLQLETEIAERKNAEQQRELVIRVLEQKNEELARFTYTVSHELKNPLITVKGFAGMIEADLSREKPDKETLRNHARRISAAVDTLDSLLTDLLRLSRAGQSTYHSGPVELRSIVDEAASILAPPLAENRVRLEIAPDLPVVSADRDRMREVFICLIENAIRFRDSGNDPVIGIGMDRESGEQIFFVRDNGTGIEPQYLERVFRLFEKLNATTPGTGVGLPIARKIIEAHGGKLWAESEGLGKGTTFRFTLPVSAPGTPKGTG